VMNVVGKVGGIILAAVGQATGNFTISLIGVGLLELSIAAGTVAFVDEGRRAPSREGRSWLNIARSAWGLDILKERNFLWLVASRLFLLLPIVGLLEFENFFLQRSLGLNDRGAAFWNSAASVAVAVSYVAAAYPAARLSDRIGRKNVIYTAAAIAAVGLLGVTLSPTPLVATLFIAVLAIGGGSFFAVDWALMTDIIPKVTSGRFMGISNVVTAGAGPVSATISGIIMDRVGAIDFTAGPRAALGIGLLFLALSIVFLRPVNEHRREE
jgi:MFS family permease